MNETERQKIIDGEEIQLSAYSTGFSQVVALILIPFIILIFFLICIGDRKPNTSLIFGVTYFLLAAGGMSFLIIYMLRKVVKARLVGDKILFKRIFSEEEELKLVDILISSTMAIGSTRYLKINYRTSTDPKSIWIIKPGMLSLTSDIETIVEVARKHHRVHKKFE